jgi:hypothetical protein
MPNERDFSQQFGAGDIIDLADRAPLRITVRPHKPFDPLAAVGQAAQHYAPNAYSLLSGQEAPPIANVPEYGKVPSVEDPRYGRALGEEANILQNFVGAPGIKGGAALAAGAIGAGLRRELPLLSRLTGKNAAQEFYNAVKTTKEVHPQGAAVDLKSVEDYGKAKLFATPDMSAGYAVMPDGTLSSVYKHPNSPHAGIGTAIAQQSVQQGATKLDAYDTMLPAMYQKGGYQEVGRIPFDPKQVDPPGTWPYEAFSQYSGKTPTWASRLKNIRVGGPGEPDIVGMVANPPGRVASLPTRTFGDVLKLQDLALQGRHPAQFIPEARRSLFPEIYEDPRTLVQRAAAQVGQEDPALKQLFGVTRPDLYEMALAREKQGLGNLPPPTSLAAKPRGSAAVSAITTPENLQRIEDTLVEARKYPELMHGGYGWYMQDPLFQQMVKERGMANALKEYPQFNAFVGFHSPASDVLTEIHRGTTAYQMYKQGRLADYIKYGAKATKGEQPPPAVAAMLEGVPGHLAHEGHVASIPEFLRTGELSAPKTTPYIQSSGVPQTGYSWNLPAFDAMMSRGAGLADVRTPRTITEQMGAVSPAELSALAPHWRGVASRAGMNPVGAQGVGWTAWGPAVGVETELGAPKLELMAKQIMRRSRETGKTPQRVLKEGLAGKEHWMLPLGGAIGGAGLLDQYAAPEVY